MLEGGVLSVMLLSSAIVFVGLGLGWWFYGRKPIASADAPDAVEELQPQVFRVLRNKFYVDEFYQATFLRFNAWLSRVSDWFDRWIWNGAVRAVSYVVLGLSWVARSTDTYVVNRGFDEGCNSARDGRPAAIAFAGWPHAKLSSRGWCCVCGAGRISHLGWL